MEPHGIAVPFVEAEARHQANEDAGLVCYCENGALSTDHNLSERSVRPVAIGRKNYLFLGSDHGGKAAAILYSVMANAKANQVEPFA